MGTYRFGDLVVRGARFTPGDIASIAGISVETQRDWKRRGLYDARGQTVMDAARFLFARTLRDNGFKLAEAWALADAEAVGAIVFRAGQIRGAIKDRSGENVFTKNPSFRIGAAMALTGQEMVAHGDLFVWGGRLPRPMLFDTWESVRREYIHEQEPSEPKVQHSLDLQPLPRLLVKRAGVLGYVEKR